MANGIFASVLESSEDITNVFFTLDPKLIIRSDDHDFDDRVRSLTREIMFSELEHGFLHDIEIGDELKGSVDNGDIVAIDGTFAADFRGKGACDAMIVAVATVSGRDPFVSNIYTGRAQKKLFASIPDVKTLADLVDSLSDTHDDQSWPTTYREYSERFVGMASIGFKARIFDGPLITQNLATQDPVKTLLERVVDGENSINLGVIKDTRIAEPFTRLAGMALTEGEYIVVPLGMGLERRIKHVPDSPLAEINRTFGKSVVRVVFKPTVRSFAVEVHKDHWHSAMAIVLASAAKQRGMELPYQLLAVDARLRRLFPSAGENARRILAADPKGLQWLSERNER